ncbi:Cu-Zn family superoxide dismutase [Azospirillum fermentarium]|uniref:superoxide dismutase family protein n=1 Tax=Azospirillum fermentarium TaxID=1233114 RepID=UPI0022260462|nr:superoxide dismutase family protein [Azospirillum fermentarium]MCW2246258.1 Cu-Zn family superoxide dismutase [Azospirillum fermentarium]
MRHLRTTARLILGSALAVAALTAGTVSAQTAMPTATAAVKGPDGKDLGTVTLTQYPHGVVLRGQLSGLTPGPHAIHIHANGTCSPDFSAAGGHFNPGNGKHGLVESPIHSGDLPNIIADAGGKAGVEAITHLVTLGDGPDSVFKPGGTSFVVHAGPDDYTSQPAGNSGDRVGCGVITKG